MDFNGIWLLTKPGNLPNKSTHATSNVHSAQPWVVHHHLDRLESSCIQDVSEQAPHLEEKHGIIRQPEHFGLGLNVWTPPGLHERQHGFGPGTDLKSEMERIV